MTLLYDKHKEYIKKWRNNNREKYNEIIRKQMKVRYIPKLMYSFDYQCRQFRSINIY